MSAEQNLNIQKEDTILVRGYDAVKKKYIGEKRFPKYFFDKVITDRYLLDNAYSIEVGKDIFDILELAEVLDKELDEVITNAGSSRH